MSFEERFSRFIIFIEIIKTELKSVHITFWALYG
nr:MAG TPA: hypothetical protein [Caudoviricetes sp.]DAW91497.1 MAG TPA: hypothetical protein [Bacteriophage sp.]